MRCPFVSTLVAAAACAATAAAQSPVPQAYTLTSETSQDGLKIVKTISREGSKERVDSTVQGSPSKRTTIYDFSGHKVYWLFPGPEVICSSGRYPSSRAPTFEDPVTGSASMLTTLAEGAERKVVGQEAVNGLPARIEAVTFAAATPWGRDESRPSRVWLSEPDGMLLKVEGAKRGGRPATIYEVKQFAKDKPQATLFTVPANCIVTDSEMDDTGSMRAHAEGPATTIEAKGEVNLADKKSSGTVTVTERQAPPARASVTDAALTIVESAGPGPCGRKLEVRGTITVDGPTQVWYRFYANIGGLQFGGGFEGTFTFDAAGSATITKDVTFPAARAGDLKFQAGVQLKNGARGPSKTTMGQPFAIACGK